MKYIRTQDGHIFPYQVEESTEYIYEEHGEFKASPIVARADDIEELCDEFICKSKTSNFWGVSPHLNWEQYDLEYFNYYGAVWTKKGLIFVAQMNEKGELELL